MDCLLVKLEFSSLGCHIGGSHTRAIAYADSLILLNLATKSALQEMFDLCVSHITYCGLNVNVKNLLAVCLVEQLMLVLICHYFCITHYAEKVFNSFEYLGVLF